MARLIIIRLIVSIVGVTAFIGSSVAAEKVTRAEFVGSWSMVSNENLLANGTRTSPFGNGSGMLVFDRSGHFSWIVLRSDIPKFASGNRTDGTPDEIKGVALGTLVYFGTYSVDPKSNTLTMHIQSSSFANFNGQDQKRTVALKGDELTITNAAGASGGTAVVAWKRMK